jgi:hypothetical protein
MEMQRKEAFLHTFFAGMERMRKAVGPMNYVSLFTTSLLSKQEK